MQQESTTAPTRMGRTHRFLGGLVMTYGYQALLMIVGLWLTPFYLSRIGQHDYGLWLVGTQLLTYLTLTDFGVVALLPNEIAYATGRAGGIRDASDLPEIVGRTVRIVLCQLPIVLAIAVAMWFNIPSQWHDLRGPLAVVLLTFVVGFPLRMLPALLSGLQDLAFTGAMQIVIWSATTVTTVLMVRAGWNLYALALGWLLGQFLMTPLFGYRLWKRFPEVLPRKLPPLIWSATKTQLGDGFWISVGQVAQLLVANSDMLIIGRVLGPAAVVPYSCTGKLPNVLGNQANLLMHNAGPALCELKTGESRQRVLQALIALNRGLLAFSGLVFCVVLIVNHWFVDWWVTARQYGGLLLTVAVLCSMIIRHWTVATAYTVFCFGHQRRISLTNLADGIVTAAACIICAWRWGVIGAPIASIIGACLVSLPLNLFSMAKDTGSNPLRLSLAMLGGWLWRFALLSAVSAWISLHWSPKNLLEAGAAVIAVSVIYGAIMLPNLISSPLGSYLRSVLSLLKTRIAVTPTDRGAAAQTPEPIEVQVGGTSE